MMKKVSKTMDKHDLKVKRTYALFLRVTVSVIILIAVFSIYYLQISWQVSAALSVVGLVMVLLLAGSRRYSHQFLYHFLCYFLAAGMLLFFLLYRGHFTVGHIFILLIPIIFFALLSYRSALIGSTAFLTIFIVEYVGLHFLGTSHADPVANMVELISLSVMYLLITYFKCNEEITFKRIYNQITTRNHELDKAQQHISRLESVLPICSSCKKIRDKSGEYLNSDEYVRRNTTSAVTHGLCPDCLKKLYPDIAAEIEQGKGGGAD